MDIHGVVKTILTNSEEIRKHYPTVTNIRHVIKDIPYSDLKEFAMQTQDTMRTDSVEGRAYIIYNPLVNGKYDCDIWLYSTIVKIKPAEITEI